MVSALLRDHVDSHEKLAALLHVRQSATPIHVSDLASGLRLPHGDVRAIVSELCASGVLLRQDGEQVMVTRDARMRPHIDALVQAYQRDALAIVAALSRNALRRYRRSASFAHQNARRMRWRERKR